MKNFIFFGDSVCTGQYISVHNIWVSMISSHISDRIIIFNHSINGDITRTALERMPHDVQEIGPDIIYIQFGLNDCNYWESDKGLPRVSQKAFEGNLYEIISRAKTFGAKLIFVATNHPAGKTEKHKENNYKYNCSIRNVAKDTESELIDIEKSFPVDNINTKLLLDDGIHLSLNGHKLYYGLIYDIINCEICRLFGIGRCK